MINLEIFLMGLLITSTLTGLVTEAVKKILEEHNKLYKTNTLVGLIAIFVSIVLGIGYVLLKTVAINSQTLICLFALCFMSWLCAMVGYDKVIQAISQFKVDTNDKG